MSNITNFEVIIIGGSYAGLSAAMSLGRSLRKVLIIDSGLPCNRQTPQSHNFITHDGEAPAVIAAKAKEQVLNYKTVTFANDLAVKGKHVNDGFEIETQSGKTYHSKKLIFATGIADQMPDIKGFAECWGISLIHCPYCHGYEYRHKKTGLIANGERAMHLSGLINNLTPDITLLTLGNADFTTEHRNKLQMHGIGISEKRISEIGHKSGHVSHLVFEDGSQEPFEAVYAALPFKQHSNIPELLGCELTEQGYIKVDAFQKTTVTGIYACGDNSSMMRSVANAVYTGSAAGALVNKELVDEAF